MNGEPTVGFALKWGAIFIFLFMTISILDGLMRLGYIRVSPYVEFSIVLFFGVFIGRLWSFMEHRKRILFGVRKEDSDER
jgi:hypothetical protein